MFGVCVYVYGRVQVCVYMVYVHNVIYVCVECMGVPVGMCMCM